MDFISFVTIKYAFFSSQTNNIVPKNSEDYTQKGPESELNGWAMHKQAASQEPKPLEVWPKGLEQCHGSMTNINQEPEHCEQHKSLPFIPTLYFSL